MASTIKVDKIEGSTGSTITVPTGQTFTITDGLAVSGGGTGLASFTAGDILYATGSTTLAKLAKGTAEQVLAMNSGASAPDWGSVDLTVLPTISVAKGGTNIASFTAGDILYATGATTLAKLAAGTGSDTLKMNSGGTAPEWVTVAPATSDFVKLQSYSETGQSEFECDGEFTSTYEMYRLYIRLYIADNTSSQMYGRVMKSGSADTTSNYSIVYHQGYTDGTPSNSINARGYYTSQTSWKMTDGDYLEDSLSNGGIVGTVDFYDPLGTDSYKGINYNFGQKCNANVQQTQQGFMLHKATTAISGIQFYNSSGNLTNMDATLYGIKH